MNNISSLIKNTVRDYLVTHCPTLCSYGNNLTFAAMQDKLDPAFGRETEVHEIEVLTHKKSTPNVLLVGPAGCGKTAIAEQFAISNYNRLYAKVKKDYDTATKEEKAEIKATFISKYFNSQSYPIIFDLSLTSLIGGARYRGDFEDRVQRIINEIRTSEINIILFIDEFHLASSLGKTGENDSSNFAQFVKPALARGDIRVIAATTDDEVEYILKDKALMRRFSVIKVKPIIFTEKVAEKIMKRYASYHKINIDFSLASQIYEIVEMHYRTKCYPNNFIDVIDTTFAEASLSDEKEKKVEYKDILKTLSALTGHLIIEGGMIHE